jgi:hypothetical protein
MKNTSKLLIAIGFILVVVGLALFFSPIRMPQTVVYEMGPGSGTLGMAFGVWEKGEEVSVNFTVSGGDEQVNFRIEDPSRTTIYDEMVKQRLDYTFTAETGGSYSIKFQTLQSEYEKTITLMRQRSVTRGLDLTLVGAGGIIVIMFGLGLFKIIFPEKQEML